MLGNFVTGPGDTGVLRNGDQINTAPPETNFQLVAGLRDLVAALDGVRDQRRIATVCEVGRLVVDALFGDVQTWRHRTRSDLAYARLETQEGLPLTASELYRAVRVYELCDRLPALRAASGLTLSHLLVALSLQASVQGEMLRLASESHWTVRQLREAVQRMHSPPPVTGRPRVPPVLRTLGQVLASEGLFEGTEALLALSRKEARTLLETCRRARLGLERAEQNLRHVVADRARTRVLLVDSARAFASRAQQQLRRQGCNVRVAHSVAEARTAIDEGLECAIIDPLLPDGCGVQLSRHVRAAVPTARILFVTDKWEQALQDTPENATIVYKSSGLLTLRIAVATALLPHEGLDKSA